jgi:hypothetical protein
MVQMVKQIKQSVKEDSPGWIITGLHVWMHKVLLVRGKKK